MPVQFRLEQAFFILWVYPVYRLRQLLCGPKLCLNPRRGYILVEKQV